MGGMKLSISLPDQLVERMDVERGLVTRSAWIGAQLLAVLRPVDFGTIPTPKAERSPKAESKTYVAENPETLPKVPVRLPKDERLEKARAIVQQPWGGVGGRPPVQKKQK